MIDSEAEYHELIALREMNQILRHLVQLAFERAPNQLGADWHCDYKHLLGEDDGPN
jgi:hypothetical protein